MAKHTGVLPRARTTTITLAAALAAGLLAAVLHAHRASAAGSATYTATQTIPVPPASTYAGSGGGDGWAVALSSDSVYNVFHHDSQLTVACHLQSDASACWAPETITDPVSGAGFATSGHPGLWLDPATGKLYVYATRGSDDTAGVVCVDTTQAAGNTDPFCGFTALTAVGDAPTNGGISALSEPVRVSGHWYAFNYVNGVPEASGTGSDENTLLCFDLAAKAACAGQPYRVGFGSGNMPSVAFPEPQTAAIGGLVVVAGGADIGNQLGCFDTALGHTCAGAWPVTLSFGYLSGPGAPFPLLSGTGAIRGVCLPTGTDQCWDLAGGPVATPAGMPAAIPITLGWNGNAVVLGPRVYVPNGNSDEVDCYDAATDASCANFPKQFPGLSLLYTVNPDPARPTCLWVNSDGGASQIQNFDAYTGGACGQGPIRVLASSFVVDTPLCQPATYTSLQVTDPAPGTYTAGTVQFQDGDATPIPGLGVGALDATGTVPLSGLNLSTATGLPQFLITLLGTTGTPGAVTVKLTWTGTDDPSCAKPGTVVTGGGTTGQCGNTVVLAAIGSGQVWKSDTDLTVSPQLNYLYQNILAAKGTRTVGLRVIKYPADSVNVLTDGLKDVTGRNAADYLINLTAKAKANAAVYLAGEKQGLAQMWGQFTSVRVGCPAGTKIVLAGYSQGSMVVHEFLNELAAGTDTAGKKAIIGSALLADPERVPKSTVVELSDAPYNSYGVCDLGLTKAITSCTDPDPLTDIKAPFNSSAISVCSWPDPICDTSDVVSLLKKSWFNASARNSVINLAKTTHDSYRYLPATRDAGLLLGRRVARN